MTTKAVELIKNHWHGGVVYYPPTVLTLPINDANWLIEQGTAKAANKGSPVVTVRAAKRSCCGGRW